MKFLEFKKKVNRQGKVYVLTAIGNSESIREVLDLIAQIAPVDITVLVSGESGTGKEIVAKAIHKFSKRSQDDMITVNCGAIPAGIIESELFGHK